MSVWSVVKNAATLGGAYRLELAQQRLEKARSTYDATIARISRSKERIEEKLSVLRFSAVRTKRRLRLARKMIQPLQGVRRSPRIDSPACSSASGVVHAPLLHARQSGLAKHLGVATTAGSVASIAAWQGIQILGTASTGTAIVGLHGIAASNAGWAAFGGGSLATGGGGMALGHLVLPGVGLAVAVGVGAFTTHKKATAINSAASEIENANRLNAFVVRQAVEQEQRLDRAADLFRQKDACLTAAVRSARKKLRRFGWLSVAFRYCRFKTRGYFYTAEEEAIACCLEKEIHNFMEAFGVSQRRA